MLANRVSTHIRWRADQALRKRGLSLAPVSDPRLHARAPDDFTLLGVRLRLDEEWATPLLRGAIYDELYEREEAAIVAATVQPTDRVIEVGCGIGFIAVLSSRIAEAVHCYDANPAMVEAARRTLERNDARASVTTGVLARQPAAQSATFNVATDFWTSSVAPSLGSRPITVPALDFIGEIRSINASYLIVDIEGGETDLLPGPLPDSVRKICVECHPLVSATAAISSMLVALIAERFTLDLEHSRPPVLYFTR